MITITTSGSFSRMAPGDRLSFSDGSRAVVLEVHGNTATVRSDGWTRFKRWCWAKWNWRKIRDREAAFRRSYGLHTTEDTQ